MTKKQALKYTKELLDKYGLSDVEVGFHYKKHSFGCFSLNPKHGGKIDKKITLLDTFVENNEDYLVKDVIKHEVAHALTHKEYPISHLKYGGHNDLWKQNCIKLGAIPHAYGIHGVNPKIKINF